MNRPTPLRVFGITAGLAAAGAACGALAGAIGLALALLVSEGPAALWDMILMDLTAGDITMFGFAALVGAVLGSVCAPLAGWLFLRRAPLGRVFAWLTAGTITGGIAGWVFPLGLNFLAAPILGALGGFLAGALALRWKTACDVVALPSSASGAT